MRVLSESQLWHVQMREAERAATERARREGRNPAEVLDEDRLLRENEAVLTGLKPEFSRVERALLVADNQFHHEASIILGQAEAKGATMVKRLDITCDRIRDLGDPRVAEAVEALSQIDPRKYVPLVLVRTPTGKLLIADGRVRYWAAGHWELDHDIGYGEVVVPAYIVEGTAESALAAFFVANKGLNGIRPLGIVKEERKRAAWHGFALKLSDGVIAKIVGIPKNTIRNWRKSYAPPFGSSPIGEDDIVFGLTGPKKKDKIGTKTKDYWDKKKAPPKPPPGFEKPLPPGTTEQKVRVYRAGKLVGERWATFERLTTTGGEVSKVTFPWEPLPKAAEVEFLGVDGVVQSVSGRFDVLGGDLIFRGEHQTASSPRAKPPAPVSEKLGQKGGKS